VVNLVWPCRDCYFVRQCARRRKEFGENSIHYCSKEDAFKQALLAFKTNFAKQKKQRDRGEEVKPFNVQFRNYGQISVINLRKKSKVLVDFVRCENNNNNNKKNRNKKKNKKGKKEENEQKAKSISLPSSGMHVLWWQ
jgi:hypothetical protein